jgi:hypothetical protein
MDNRGSHIGKSGQVTPLLWITLKRDLVQGFTRSFLIRKCPPRDFDPGYLFLLSQKGRWSGSQTRFLVREYDDFCIWFAPARQGVGGRRRWFPGGSRAREATPAGAARH